MLASILLLVVLFLAGFLTTNLPTKKFFAWFIAFNLKNSPNFNKFTKEKESTTKNSKKDEIVKRVFATFDKNSDGFITKQELRLSLKNIGMAMEEMEIEDLIKNVDTNGDGLIDLSEFNESFESLLNRGGVSKDDDEREKIDEGEEEVSSENKERDLMKEAFDVFDEDKDGLITVEELGLVLTSMGFEDGCKLEDCKKMIKNVDIDGDGMVNFDEFKNMMRSGQGFVTLA